MPVKGASKAKRSISAKIDKLADQKTPQALVTAAYMVGARADFYVPIDTSALINSRKVELVETAQGWKATISYQSAYAAMLHEAAQGSWKPKPAPSPGKKTGGYNPRARPDWLNIGADEAWPEVKVQFRKAIKL